MFYFFQLFLVDPWHITLHIKVKIWRLSGEEATPCLDREVCIGHGVLLESIKAHSTAANIIAVASLAEAYVVDIEKNAVAISEFPARYLKLLPSHPILFVIHSPFSCMLPS